MHDPPDPGFPDLTLPQKAARESEADAIVNLPSVPPSSEITTLSESSWKAGDVVLAPWGPTFLYVGQVDRIEGSEAFVAFREGDSAWTALGQLRPVALTPGQRVYFPQGNPGSVAYLAAAVVEVRGEDVCLLPDDATKETWAPLDAIVISRQPLEPFNATVSRIASEAFLAALKPGDEVWAPWEAATLHPAKVDRIQGDDVHVRHDGNYWAWVKRQQLLPLEFSLGMKALARWRMESAYHPCEVEAIEGKEVLVRYLDGSEEWLPPTALALTRVPFGPKAWCSLTPAEAVEWRNIWWAVLLLLALMFVRIACA